MKPPALARALVRLLSDAEDREFLLDDLCTRFHELAESAGPRAARRWYWSQALSVVRWALRPDIDLFGRRSWAGLIGELRSGVRTLARRPLYAVGVSGTLALGLAAATLVFAVAWRVWLAPMPYPDPDRVVRLYEVEPFDPATGSSQMATESRRQRLSIRLLEALRSHSWRTIGAVSAVIAGTPSEWTRDGEMRRITISALSPDGFGILGIVPTLGRLPAAGPSPEVFLTERFWRTELGADPDVVGSAELIMNGQAQRVVGVGALPSVYPGHADFVKADEWKGEALRQQPRQARWLDAIARLRPGHSVTEAKAELNAFIAALGEVHPEHRGWGMDVVVLADDLLRPFRGVIALLLAAATTFLLLAGVNVLGLVAERRVEGRRDRSIRLALGASEARLLRGSLVESLVLAGVGSVAGVLGAYWLVGPIRALVPQDVPRLAEVAVTPPLVLGGLAVGVALGVVIGLAGYVASRGVKPSVGRAPVRRAVGVGGRRALVVGQVALTTLLTAGGAAILQRVATLKAVDLGFEAEGVSTASTILTPSRYPSPESRWNTWRAILDGLHDRGIPAAVSFNSPMSGDEMQPIPIKPPGGSREIFFELHAVTADYFSVMGIEALAGRVFEPADDRSRAPVIVSEEFVQRYFPPGTPVERAVGRAIGPIPLDPGWTPTVVGVVESTRHEGPDAPAMPDLYMPFSKYWLFRGTLLVGGEPDEIAAALSHVAEQMTPGLRWTPLMPYTSHLKEWFAPFHLQILTIGVLGALGLLLASLGLYALMAYQVASRRQEIGIRKAVGATDRRLMWGVLSGGVVMTAVGALIGLAAWYRLLPLTGQLVEGIGSAGSLVPLSAALVVGGSCAVATLVPAVRATRVDPVVTLKVD